MRISIILAITLAVAIGQGQAFAAELTGAAPAGYEAIRMRTDGKITDANGTIIAIPLTEDPRNTDAQRYYVEVDSNGGQVAGSDFKVVRDTNAGYVRQVSTTSSSAATSTSAPATVDSSATRMAEVLATGRQVDQMLGNSTDKLNKLKQISEASSGQYSEQYINNYKIYLAATTNSNYTLSSSDRQLATDIRTMTSSEAYQTALQANNNATPVNISTNGNLNSTQLAQLQQSTGLSAEQINQISGAMNSGSGNSTAQSNAAANREMDNKMNQIAQQLAPMAISAASGALKSAQTSFSAYTGNMQQYTQLVSQYQSGAFSAQQMPQVQASAQSYLAAANVNYGNYTAYMGQANQAIGGVVNGASGMVGQAASGIAGGISGLTSQGMGQMQNMLSQSGVTQLTSQLSGAVTGAVGGVTGAIGGAIGGVTGAVGGVVNGAVGGITKGVNGMLGTVGFGSGFGNGLTSFNVSGDFAGAATEAMGMDDGDIDGSTPLTMPWDYNTSDGKNMMIACDQKPAGGKEGNLPVIGQNSTNCKRSLDNFRLGRKLSNADSKDATIPLVTKKSGSSGKVEVDMQKPKSGGMDTQAGQYKEYIEAGKEVVKAYSGREAVLCKKAPKRSLSTGGISTASEGC